MAQHLIELTAEQEMDFLLSWATQTIALCISVAPRLDEAKPNDSGQLPDTSEGSAVAIELWRDALAQCGAVSEEVGTAFVHHVFRWCDRSLTK